MAASNVIVARLSIAAIIATAWPVAVLGGDVVSGYSGAPHTIAEGHIYTSGASAGRRDLLVGIDSHTVGVVYWQTSGPKKGNTYNLRADSNVRCVAVGELDDDSDIDGFVATDQSEIVVLIRDEQRYDPPQLCFSVPDSPTFISTADLNGDGRSDPIVICEGWPVDPNDYPGGVIAVLYSNDEETRFDPAVAFSLGQTTQPTMFAMADLNGDSIIDVAVVNEGTNNISILHGETTTTTSGGERVEFKLVQTVTVGRSPRWLAIDDIDGDEAPDIAVVNSDSLSFSILHNENGQMARLHEYPLHIMQYFGAATVIACTDVTADGFADIVVVGDTDTTIYPSETLIELWKGDGSGTFQEEYQYGTGTLDGVRSLVVADFDYANGVDLAIGYSSGDSIQILYNFGDGRFW